MSISGLAASAASNTEFFGRTLFLLNKPRPLYSKTPPRGNSRKPLTAKAIPTQLESECLKSGIRCYNRRTPTKRSRGESEAPVPVQMELKRIIISEIHDQQVIMLREVDGDRSFPIVIGIFEATSIDRRVKSVPTPRPLTHDLVANVVEILGGEIQDVLISELVDHTYFAKLRVRKDGELLEVDCRPSDAIALAVTARVPVYVNEDVLNELADE